MRYWLQERLDRLSISRLAVVRARAVRLRYHPKQLRSPHYEAGLAEFDAYVAARMLR